MKKTLTCLLLTLILILSTTAAVFANDYINPYSIKPTSGYVSQN